MSGDKCVQVGKEKSHFQTEDDFWWWQLLINHSSLVLKSIQIRVRPGCCLFKGCEIQHVQPAGLIQVRVSRCVVASRSGCKKTGFFSSYPVSVAQETGRNSPCDPFRLGCFYFLYMFYWVCLHPHCLEMLKRNFFHHDCYLFYWTVIQYMEFKIWIRALSEFLAVAFHGQLQCISDLLVDVTNWTIRKIKTFLFNLKLRFKKQEIQCSKVLFFCLFFMIEKRITEKPYVQKKGRGIFISSLFQIQAETLKLAFIAGLQLQFEPGPLYTEKSKGPEQQMFI